MAALGQSQHHVHHDHHEHDHDHRPGDHGQGDFDVLLLAFGVRRIPQSVLSGPSSKPLKLAPLIAESECKRRKGGEAQIAEERSYFGRLTVTFRVNVATPSLPTRTAAVTGR